MKRPLIVQHPVFYLVPIPYNMKKDKKIYHATNSKTTLSKDQHLPDGEEEPTLDIIISRPEYGSSCC